MMNNKGDSKLSPLLFIRVAFNRTDSPPIHHLTLLSHFLSGSFAGLTGRCQTSNRAFSYLLLYPLLY
jgi:hypothetical protein